MVSIIKCTFFDFPVLTMDTTYNSMTVFLIQEKKLIKTIPQKPASSENWFPAKPAPERKFAPRAHNSDSRMRRTEPQSNQYATKENQRDSRISQQAPKISQHDPRMTRNPKKMRADEMSRSVTARLGAKRHLSPSSESVDEVSQSEVSC